MPTGERLSRIADDILVRGWSCCDHFVTDEHVARLRSEARVLETQGEFRPAAVGAGSGRAVRSPIRSDDIHWLTQPFSASLQALADELERLRLAFNRALSLGLFDLELHFARYRPGHCYARHRDQLAGRASRVLSFALYLNDDWRSEEGGALRLYMSGSADVPFRDFLPEAGRLMSFLSDPFEHEVLPATRERLSISGWFRRRDRSWPHP